MIFLADDGPRVSNCCKLLGKLISLRFRRLITPSVEQRAAGNARERGVRFPRRLLLIEVPHVTIPQRIGMRISGKDRAGNIARQGPAPSGVDGLANYQVDRSEVTSMIVSARADHQSDQVARLDAEVFDRLDLGGFAELDFAPRESSTFTPSAQLQRPGHAIAAVGVGVDHLGFDSSLAHASDYANRRPHSELATGERRCYGALRFRECELPGPTNWPRRSAWPECPSP